MNDLTKHFLAGALISSLVCAVLVLILGTSKTAADWAIGMAVLSAFSAGLAKELYDKYVRKTYFDVADFVCTWIGAAVPMVVWGVIQNYIG